MSLQIVASLVTTLQVSFTIVIFLSYRRLVGQNVLRANGGGVKVVAPSKVNL
jgi:hypothetical protein